MDNSIIYKEDVFANVIHSNSSVLVVLERMDIKLGFGNSSIEHVAVHHNINPDAFLIIINLFCNNKYVPDAGIHFEFIPDILRYLRRSHACFLMDKIPAIQKSIQHLVDLFKDSAGTMVDSFYTKYIEEVTDHIENENDVVFPYIESLLKAYHQQSNPHFVLQGYDIGIYGDHHDDIEIVLRDLKNILIRHLPQKEVGRIRRLVLQQLFDLESDLFSHTRVEDEVLIPLVQKLEDALLPSIPQP